MESIQVLDFSDILNFLGLQSCFSLDTKVTEVEFDAAGAYGGIINGNLKPGEEPSQEIENRQIKEPNWKPKHPFKRRNIKMECLPFNSIILALGNPTIDYLSLDIEGAEFPVLKTIDFSQININVISLEVSQIGKIFDGSEKRLNWFFKKHGYNFYKNVNLDSIYIKEGFLSKDEL